VKKYAFGGHLHGTHAQLQGVSGGVSVTVSAGNYKSPDFDI
jgi:hypothetical protein